MSKINNHLLSQMSDDELNESLYHRDLLDLRYRDYSTTNTQSNHTIDEELEVYSTNDIKEAIQHTKDTFIQHSNDVISNRVDVDKFSEKLLHYLIKLKHDE